MAEVGVLVPLIVVPVELVTGHEFEPGVTHVAVDGNRRQAAAPVCRSAAAVPGPPGPGQRPRRRRPDDGRYWLGPRWPHPTEEAHAVAVLFDLKMSGAAISRAIGRDKTHVTAARKAATLTPEAAGLTERHALTLLEMATIAECRTPPEQS